MTWSISPVHPPGPISTALTTSGIIALTFSSGLSVNAEPPAGGWSGNFPPNTVVVTNQTGLKATIEFTSPVQGFGVTIDDGFSGNFTETLQAEAGSTVLLDTATASQSGGSLLFLGFLEPAYEISIVTINIAGIGGTDDFAFGNISLLDYQPAASVPEPETSILIAMGGAILMLLRNARKKNAAL
jgi:hypothetical protein